MIQVKYLNMKKTILEKIQCILQLHYSFYGVLFSNLNIDTRMHIFEVHFFHFLFMTNIDLSSFQKCTTLSLI
jgi:hypothetical protein